MAKALVSRRYVRRILKRTFCDAPPEILAASPITPAHLLSMRPREQQCRLPQDERARQEAEDWTAAWREEEVRARQQGYWPEQQPEDASYAYPDDSSARSNGYELRRIVQASDNPEDRELCRRMFPLLKL